MLRQWRDTDFLRFGALNADPEVMRYFPAPLTRADSDLMARRLQGLIAERGWGLWAVEVKASRSFVGFVGLHVPTVVLPFSPCVEVGWRLAQEAWGQGYATEGARAALKFAFQHLALPEVVSFTSVSNLRSQRVMQRLGMVPDAQTFAHPALERGHPLSEHCVYRIRPPVCAAEVVVSGSA